MADLSNLQAAETVKIVGSNASGLETYPLAVDANQQALVSDSVTHSMLSSIASGLGVSVPGILKQYEAPITSRAELDIPNSFYTVGLGKKFLLTSFVGSYDAQATVYLRLKKQTNGIGAYSTVARITLQVSGQGQSTVPINFGNGVLVGNAGDVFKMTIETSLIKGTYWAGYTGVEL